MMTAKEACDLLMKKMQGFEPIRCIEYDSVFAFAIVPNGAQYSDKNLNSLWSVNKTTKQIRDFKPFHIPIGEYRNGKEIHDFK